MSQETRYVVRRADGKFLVIVSTMNKARAAIWIDNIELATSWPFMTGATLAMGLDLDPCLQAERSGWDVVPVSSRPPAERVITFSVTIPALLVMCLLSVASIASAQQAQGSAFQWKPVVAVAAGQTFDLVSTQRFLTNGSGCTESNRFVGPAPKLSTLVAQKAAVIAGASLFSALLGKSESKPIRIIGQAFAYGLGALGAKSGIHNLQTCGW